MYPSSFPSSPVGNSLRTLIQPPWSPSKSLNCWPGCTCNVPGSSPLYEYKATILPESSAASWKSEPQTSGSVVSLIFRFTRFMELTLEPFRGIGNFGGKAGLSLPSDRCLNIWLVCISSREAGGGWRGTPCGCLGGLPSLHPASGGLFKAFGCWLASCMYRTGFC